MVCRTTNILTYHCGFVQLFILGLLHNMVNDQGGIRAGVTTIHFPLNHVRHGHSKNM